ncbi:MAG TPA: methyltransferase domain-containing protein [Gemmataceae bacterium]|jgi:predicted SAM-dependent methyltransferase
MVGQRWKEIYFFLTHFLTWPNYYLAKLRLRLRAGPKGHYLHLACGAIYIPGMINIDGNWFRKTDLWLDLRNGLPCATGSVAFVYCSHAIGNILPEEALQLLGEIRRVLRPDGVARIALPSFEHALLIAAGKAESKWPRSFDDPYGQAINYLFCDGTNKYFYSFSVFDGFARQAGFREVFHYSQEHGCQPKRYGDVEVGNEPKGSFVVELRP